MPTPSGANDDAALLLVVVDVEGNEDALQKLTTGKGDVAEGNLGLDTRCEVDAERDEAAIKK